MNLLGLFQRNPGRDLALHGHAQRKAKGRALYKATHDAMRRKLGLPPIAWRD